MNEQEGTDFYLRHQGLVRKLSKRFSIIYGREFEEMVDQAQMCLVWCIGNYDRYDPTQGAESTWTYQSIYWGLMTHCRKPRLRTVSMSVFEDEEGETTFEPIAKQGWTENLLREVGEDAKFLINMIVDAPAEIVDEMAPNLRCRGREALKAFLIDEKDWDRVRLTRAWDEVEQCLLVQG